MKQTRKTVLIVAFTLLSILGSSGAGILSMSQISRAAAPPNTMNFQGRLTNPSGNVVADGQYNMQFRVYSVASGGTALWSETRETTNRVQVTNGLFSVQLGAVTPLAASMFDATDLYFEITMATPATATCTTAGCATWESPMTPRNKLATSAYAFNATKAQNAENATNAQNAINAQDSDTLDGLDSTAFASASGSSSYIQNTTSPQTASFNVTGSGQIGGALTVNGSALYASSVDSATAFVVQDSTSAALFTADTANNRILIGSASNGVEFSANGMVLSGTARGTDRLTVSAEYPGLTFRGDGTNNTGNLTSDFCSDPLSINASACSTGVATNYYEWTTAETTTQDYDLYFKLRYPDRASQTSNGGVTAFTMQGFVTDTATDSVSATVYKGGTTCGTYNIATTNATWTTNSMIGAFATCDFAAGEEMVIKINLAAGQNKFARVGDIELTYRSER